MRKIFYFILASSFMAGCSSRSVEESFAGKVDPLIGSGGHGHVFVGASVPFGMVQVGPTGVPQGWDWCSGYHRSDSTVIGFSHTHLSGTGCGDLLDITVMPVVGTDLTYARGSVDSIGSGLWSYADRNRETVRPGYYSVPLTRYGILAEMTSTSRVGFHRYTFPDSCGAAVVFDLRDGGNWDRPVDIHMEPVGDSRIQGWRHSTGWADDQKVYFVADFSCPFSKFEIKDEDGLFGRADFGTLSSSPLLVKVALSAVSVEGAAANMAAELPGWDFDGTVMAADRAWNDQLRRIRIYGASPEEERIFYTALFHTMIAPSEFSDAGASYPEYTTFSLWDTYRAAMPLLSITQPGRYADMINTMIQICHRQGRLPVWHLWGCETDCMVGNPAIPVVADAIVKGIPGIDRESAYKALLTTAMDTTRGNGLRQKYGYIPFDLHAESVAYDMEYALADGAVAQAALVMGDSASYRYFSDRSRSYRYYFDPSTGLVRGKDSHGCFRNPFRPFDASHRANDYCEGTAWQYTWLVPHDIEGLRDCFGSNTEMLAKLDSLFTVESPLEGDDISPDVSGLIGQYAHGNEPGHHTAYIYTMLGYPDKTAEKVREILTTMYSSAPDGICGNEDVGQMSAWYVLSAMGLYEVEPGSGLYWFGYPLFRKTELDVPGGTFRIISEGGSAAAPMHLVKVTLDGKELKERYVRYADIMRGGELKFEWQTLPSEREKRFGRLPKNP
ncbi:MAG: GH92 family glycosyl hydrolase [Muribaculaceae bacterium]|nr:GH92 family glycosyl hydrolase [Muribaculaceae bacterium]